MKKALLAVFSALAFVACAHSYPAPQMAFEHGGKYYCAAYTPASQEEGAEEPVLFIYETTELGCPDVTVDDKMEWK